MTRPRIGLTASFLESDRGDRTVTCNQFYYQAIRAAGGEAVVIAPEEDLALVDEVRQRFDGLIFIGGPDLAGPFVPPHPASEAMHPLRQAWDLALLKAALAWPEMPLLGICLGCQELNVACGGTLVPHLPDRSTAIEHRRFGTAEQWHTATALPDSRLASIIGNEEIPVNSSHHQAVDRLGEGLRIVARASDGTVEAIESTVDPDRFLLGLQWHPERIFAHVPHLALFRALIDAARQA